MIRQGCDNMWIFMYLCAGTNKLKFTMVNKLLIFFVAMLPLFTLSACGDDDDDDDAMGVVGTWRYDEGQYFVQFEFNASGTGSLTEKSYESDSKATFDWTAHATFIYVTNPKAVYGYDPEDFNEDGSLMGGGKAPYRLEGNTLWLATDFEGDSYDFVPLTRVG